MNGDDGDIGAQEERRHAALVETIARRLDLDGDLADALAVTSYRALSRHFAEVLDLPAGLAAALAAAPSAPSRTPLPDMSIEDPDTGPWLPISRRARLSAVLSRPVGRRYERSGRLAARSTDGPPSRYRHRAMPAVFAVLLCVLALLAVVVPADVMKLPPPVSGGLADPYVLLGHDGSVHAVGAGWVDGDPVIVSGGQDRTVRLWNLATNASIGSPVNGYAGVVTSTVLSPGGHTLATVDSKGLVDLWNVDDATGLHDVGQLDPFRMGAVSAVTFSSDGRTLAAAGSTGSVELWDVATAASPRPVVSLLNGAVDAALAVAFSPDGRTLATASSAGPVELWDIADPARPRPVVPTLSGNTGVVSAVAFSPDGRTLASASDSGFIDLWDLADPTRPRLIGRPLIGVSGTVSAVAFSPDGRTIAASSSDGTVTLWDGGHGLWGNATTLTTQSRNLLSIAFGPAGNSSRIAAGGSDGKIYVWNLDG